MGNRRPTKKKRVPLGKLPPDTAEDDAVVTPADIERAKVFWEKHAPPEYRDLLDADIEQGDEFS